MHYEIQEKTKITAGIPSHHLTQPAINRGSWRRDCYVCGFKRRSDGTATRSSERITYIQFHTAWDIPSGHNGSSPIFNSLGFMETFYLVEERSNRPKYCVDPVDFLPDNTVGGPNRNTVHVPDLGLGYAGPVFYPGFERKSVTIDHGKG